MQIIKQTAQKKSQMAEINTIIPRQINSINALKVGSRMLQESKFLSSGMDQVQVLLQLNHTIGSFIWMQWSCGYISMLITIMDAWDYCMQQLCSNYTTQILRSGNFQMRIIANAKHSILFTAIDPEHGIEEEYRKMKIKGGFISITWG